MLQKKTVVSPQVAALDPDPDMEQLAPAIPASLAWLVQASAALSTRAADAKNGSWHRALLPHFLDDNSLRVHLEYRMLAELGARSGRREPKIMLSCAIGPFTMLHLKGRLLAEPGTEPGIGMMDRRLYAQGFVSAVINLQSWHVTDHTPHLLQTPPQRRFAS